MTIPTISIDGVSMPVTRDGTNLLSNMPLGEVASQVLEQGAAFEAAVEQFQQIMAEFTTGESVQAYVQSASSDRDNGQLARFDGAGVAIDSTTATTDTPASSVPSPASFVPVSVTEEGVSTSLSPLVMQEDNVTEATVSSSAPPAEEANTTGAPSDWDNGHLARCGGAGVAIDGATATDGAPASSAVHDNLSAPVEVPEGASASPSPVVEQKLDLPEAVATSSDTPVEEANATSVPLNWDNGHLARSGGAGEATASVHDVASTPADVTSMPADVTSTPANVTLASDVTYGVESGASLVRGVDQSQVAVSQAPAAVSPDQPSVPEVDSQAAQAKVTPAVEQERDSLVAVEQELDPPVLQSAPVSVPAQMQVIDVKDVAVEPVQVVAARVVHQVVATPAQVLIEAASAVADTIVVSPGLLRGAGEVQVQLRPDVLEGTVIQISTTASGSLTVQFAPVTENMAELLEKCAPQLVTYLSERIHSVQIAVNVKRDEKLKG